MSNLENKILELQLRRLRTADATVQKGNKEVPNKKKSKPLGYKLQNTFEKNLKNVPGGSMSRGVTAAVIKMVAAASTGTRVVDQAPGTMKSMRNCNTTQGNYNQTILRDQTGDVISYADGRRR